MDNFHSTIIERLAAEYRADALAQVHQVGLARRVAARHPSRTRICEPLLSRLVRLVAQAALRRAAARLRH
jgi:hypothetical protein